MKERKVFQSPMPSITFYMRYVIYGRSTFLTSTSRAHTMEETVLVRVWPAYLIASPRALIREYVMSQNSPNPIQ